MASYRVEIKVSAIRELEGIGRKGDRQRLARRIAALGTQPRPPGCQKLAGDDERYRVRQGRYRVIYAIDDGARGLVIEGLGRGNVPITALSRRCRSACVFPIFATTLFGARSSSGEAT